MGPLESSPGSHPAIPPLLIILPRCGFTSASCPSSEPAPGLHFLPYMGNPAADTVLVSPLGQGPGSGSGGGVVPHRQCWLQAPGILHWVIHPSFTQTFMESRVHAIHSGNGMARTDQVPRLEIHSPEGAVKDPAAPSHQWCPSR